MEGDGRNGGWAGGTRPFWGGAVRLRHSRHDQEYVRRRGCLARPAFFLVLGSFELVWAWVTLVYREPTMIGIGVAGFISSIILYLVALATPLTPFGVKQQTL